MRTFLVGLFCVCAGTLMCEVTLTRLLSVTSWYHLAFVSVSMAMFGMTAGALAVQLRPAMFTAENVPRRLAQAATAAAVSMPLSLMTILAVPIYVTSTAQSLYSFLLVLAVLAVPFFFSGVAVCLSLTRAHLPIGRTYFADLGGASAGCFASAIVLSLMDTWSAILAISGLMFFGASAYASYAKIRRAHRYFWYALAMVALAALNASTVHGIRPTWIKGELNNRADLRLEVWNPISWIRAYNIRTTKPTMWGPSEHMPDLRVQEIFLDIDGGASTVMTRFDGDLSKIDYLRYDVTSAAAQLRQGGSAAIIGVGGGRDVLNCALNGYRRIQGIELNSGMVDLSTRRLGWFSQLTKIPGFSVQTDEGRSYLTRSGERFDLIQASLVDTFAATAAGAMALSENALYTVDGWRVFYHHLKPGGLIAFSRWWTGISGGETPRLFALAWATLLSEGVKDPESHIAVLGTDTVATLIASNQPLSANDLRKLRDISEKMAFKRVFMPGEGSPVPEIATVAATRNLEDLSNLRTSGFVDYSPPFDSSPYFFNGVHLVAMPRIANSGARTGSFNAMVVVVFFMLAAAVLVGVIILVPAGKSAKVHWDVARPPAGGMVYFLAIGLGFMLIEMSMIQQLAILLGHPIYSLVVVLAGLILFTGLGSQASDRLRLKSSRYARIPAVGVALAIMLYWAAVVPTIHRVVSGTLWQRIGISLALVAPCGFLMGFCFPVGLRWLSLLKQDHNLPWMWALNGAAGALGGFIAVLISMDSTISTCVLCAAGCYLLAGLALPGRAGKAQFSPSAVEASPEQRPYTSPARER